MRVTSHGMARIRIGPDMPYEWNDTRSNLTLWPHRSLPPTGFAAVIGGFFVLAMVPMFALVGTVFWWGLVPFGLAALAALWIGLRLSYRSGRVVETLELAPENTLLHRRDPNGAEREWRCNTYWARAAMHDNGGPVPHYVTLSGNGRTVEIGSFLSEDERKRLFGELVSELRRYRDAGALDG